ncbi:MAG: hypothetical protein HYV07_02030 [Deltaproteobacteria bacterium]|nr:hypothetical protein [Deltaproteobacteria bacterium]
MSNSRARSRAGFTVVLASFGCNPAPTPTPPPRASSLAPTPPPPPRPKSLELSSREVARFALDERMERLITDRIQTSYLLHLEYSVDAKPSPRTSTVAVTVDRVTLTGTFDGASDPGLAKTYSFDTGAEQKRAGAEMLEKHDPKLSIAFELVGRSIEVPIDARGRAAPFKVGGLSKNADRLALLTKEPLEAIVLAWLLPAAVLMPADGELTIDRRITSLEAPFDAAEYSGRQNAVTVLSDDPAVYLRVLHRRIETPRLGGPASPLVLLHGSEEVVVDFDRPSPIFASARSRAAKELRFDGILDFEKASYPVKITCERSWKRR